MSGSGEYISREAAIEAAKKSHLYFDIKPIINSIPAADVRPVPEGGIGEMSDGYHTFNGLYYQRMVLFASLVNAHQDKAWKSWKHEDGKPCLDGGWFIVGIDTPQGSYTYHYEDKYWNWFECKELPVAKHWDGHTEEDVTRLLSLDVRPRWIPVSERLPKYGERVLVFGGVTMYVAYYDKNRYGGESWHKLNSKSHYCNPTHWMPLPEPPEELIGTDMRGGIHRDDAGNVIDWGITGPPGDVGKTEEE